MYLILNILYNCALANNTVGAESFISSLAAPYMIKTKLLKSLQSDKFGKNVQLSNMVTSLLIKRQLEWNKRYDSTFFW